MLQSLHLIALSLLSASLLAIASPLQLSRSLSDPLPPSQDPFYSATPGFEQKSPGSILRIRHAPGNLTTVVGNASAAYNIVYRTTDSNYQPSWAVTTLFVPHQNLKSAKKPASLLSLQLAYNSVDVDASPSYAMYYDYTFSALGAPSTDTDISMLLGFGWYVSVPDHEGPHASFAMGIQEGHATLDNVRAVLSSGILPKSTKTNYAMWGYSGGSVASEWASELQEQYAPELEFSGMAIGGCVPNVTEAVYNITGSQFSGLVPGFYLGLTSQNKDARDYLLSRLKKSGPYNATFFLEDLTLNVEEAFAAYANQDVFEYFIGGAQDTEAPILQAIANRNSYQGYHGVPSMPVFTYKAIGDEFSTIKSTDKLVERWCGIGVDVEYQRNTAGGHIAEIVNGRLRAMGWLKTIFDGTYQRTGCRVTNVTVAITDNPL